MEVQKFIRSYMEKFKEIQESLFEYLDDQSTDEVIFNNLILLLEKHKMKENPNDLRLVLHLITKISNNYHRAPNFFTKIEKILNSLKEDIKNHFSEDQIFIIFKSSKCLLLFLFDEKVITPSKYMSFLMASRMSYMSNFPHLYFYPEFKDFYEKSVNKDIDERCPEIRNIEDIESFNQKRKTGENDEYICQLIREDSIDEFVIYVTQKNVKLNNKIKFSYFESNYFLMKTKQQTFIEYAAFYGSIQIFQYLKLNGAELTPSLWLYAIHGGNAEIIHLLEENHILPEDQSFHECLKYSIKNYQKDITNYLKNNVIEEKFENENQLNIQFYNFSGLSELTIEDNQMDELFFNFCKYDYITIVDFILKNSRIDINRTFLQILNDFNEIQNNVYY